MKQTVKKKYTFVIDIAFPAILYLTQIILPLGSSQVACAPGIFFGAICP